MKALVICGATASGKTALSVACAKRLQTEIISADSMLIYRGLSIGTAKPTMQEREEIPHHLIDVVSPKESFSVSDYKSKAREVVDRLFEEGKTPIICGGTGFYVDSLLYERSFGGAGANENVRQKYEEVLREKGKEHLHSLLASVDPESASILHENDVKRVVRALEIYETTGQKKSAQKDDNKPRFDFVGVCIDYPRDLLYERIGKRVDIMFENGLKEEVQSLLFDGVSTDNQCMQGIGYKEVAQGLAEGWSNEKMKETIKQNTRRYAKRQITYFKRMENNHWIPYDEISVDRVTELLEEEK